MSPAWWRRFWLILMLVADVAMLFFWWLTDVYFFWTFVGINVVVCVGELVSFIVRKKTLSTATTQALQNSTKKRVFAYLALSLMMLSLTFLCLHLVWV